MFSVEFNLYAAASGTKLLIEGFSTIYSPRNSSTSAETRLRCDEVRILASALSASGSISCNASSIKSAIPTSELSSPTNNDVTNKSNELAVIRTTTRFSSKTRPNITSLSLEDDASTVTPEGSIPKESKPLTSLANAGVPGPGSEGSILLYSH